MRGALVLLAVLLLAAPALGDHVYSHRFVVEGRLVGSDGTPLPGRVITLTSEGDDLLEPCREGPHDSITNEHGDFRFCYHQHHLTSSTRVTVSAGNASDERAVDVAFRKMTFLLREPNETGIAPPGWNETYRISGRAWQPGPQVLEGVQVFGLAVVDLPVNLTIRSAEGSESVFRTTTDAFGDFDLAVETALDPSTLDLTLEAAGRGQKTELDWVFHRTSAPIFVPASGAERPERDNEAPVFEAPPGSSTPPATPVLIVAVALGLVAAVMLSRRKVG